MHAYTAFDVELPCTSSMILHREKLMVLGVDRPFRPPGVGPMKHRRRAIELAGVCPQISDNGDTDTTQIYRGTLKKFPRRKFLLPHGNSLPSAPVGLPLVLLSFIITLIVWIVKLSACLIYILGQNKATHNIYSNNKILTDFSTFQTIKNIK